MREVEAPDGPAPLRARRWPCAGSATTDGLALMRLVGIVAEDATRRPPGDPDTLEILDLGETGRLRVEAPGYLYAYANDSWASYGDNTAGIRLTVTEW